MSSSGQLMKKLMSHSAVYWIGTMLYKMIGFLLIPLYTRYLEPSDYGMLEISVLTVDVLSLVIGLQLTHAAAKFHDAAETPEEKRRVISTAIIIVTAISSLFYMSLMFFSDNISMLIFKTVEYSYLFKTLFIASIFGIVLQVPLLYIRIQDKSKLFVFITLTQLLLTVGLTIWFVVFLGMSVFGVLLAHTIVAGVVCLILLFSTLRSIGFKYDAGKAKEMAAYSAPLIPGVAGLFILNSSDRFFLNEMTNLEEMGLYAIGYKFGFLINPLLIGPFLLVWGAKMFEVYRHPDRQIVLNRVLAGMGFILVFSALSVSLFIDEILLLMTTPQYYGAAIVVPLIAFAYVMNGLSNVLSTPLYAEKKTGAIGYINSSAAIVCLILNYFFIREFGMLGAAIATLLSFVYICVGTMIVSQRLSDVRWDWLNLVKLIVVAVVILNFGEVSFESVWLAIFYKIFLLMMFALALVVVGFVSKRDVQSGISVVSQFIGGKLGRQNG